MRSGAMAMVSIGLSPAFLRRLAFATVLGLWAATAASARHVPAHDQVALDARGEALGGLQADAHIVGADGGV